MSLQERIRSGVAQKVWLQDLRECEFADYRIQLDRPETRVESSLDKRPRMLVLLAAQSGHRVYAGGARGAGSEQARIPTSSSRPAVRANVTGSVGRTA